MRYGSYDELFRRLEQILCQIAMKKAVKKAAKKVVKTLTKAIQEAADAIKDAMETPRERMMLLGSEIRKRKKNAMKRKLEVYGGEDFV